MTTIVDTTLLSALVTSGNRAHGNSFLTPPCAIKAQISYDRYYGLDGYTDPDDSTQELGNKIGSGFDFTVGSEFRYHVTSNLYLLGRAQVTALDEDTHDSPTIKDQTYGEAYLGVAFFNDKTKKKSSRLDAKPYFRLAHGWATPSNIGEIFEGKTESDSQNNAADFHILWPSCCR